MIEICPLLHILVQVEVLFFLRYHVVALLPQPPYCAENRSTRLLLKHIYLIIN